MPSYKGKYVYDVEIDNVIVNILKNTVKVSSGKLKSEVEKKIKRTISPHTYSTHLSSLMDQEILQKEDLGRGNNMFYSLTESAEKKVELRLLGIDGSKIELFRRIYNVLFFYHVFYYYPKIVFSEAEFREFLIKIGAKENDLSWGLISNGHNYESVELVYGRINEFLHMKNIPIEEYKRRYKNYWKERPRQTTVLEDIQLVCYPLRNNLEIFIDRFEHWEINKKSPNRKYLTEYHLHLCGFSVDDIMEASGLDQDNVKHAIENLKKLDLIEPIIFFDGAPKYRFKDKELEGLFGAVWELYSNAEILLLFRKWCYIEKPTQDELDRFERLVGRKERERIEILCERIRTQIKLALKRSKTIHQFIKYIKENVSFFWKFLEYPYDTPNTFAEYIMYLKQYKQAPYQKEIPLRIRKIFSKYERFQNLVPNELIRWIQAKNEQQEEDPFIYSILRQFIQNSDKVLAHTTNEVNDFHHYLQYVLDKRLESPAYYDQDIEDINIQFKEAIMKYSFLEDILNDVCPKVLNTQSEKQEQESIYIVREKINNEIIMREIREMSEIREFENRLNSNYIPFSYTEEKLYNPVTHKVENRQSFRLLDLNDLCSDKLIIGFHTLELVHDPETQQNKYKPILHRNDLYQKQKPSKKEIEQFQAKLRSKTARVVYVVKQKIKGKMMSREIRAESEIHEFEASLKSGTTYYYNTQETFNPSTQEIEYREIFHLLNKKEIESGKFSAVHVIQNMYNPTTRRVEELPVLTFLDTNKTHTTKKKSKKSRDNR
ncbi:MAG: hypothetical protein ACRD8W_00090 [Nitrososphaeraceae archaeon]